MSQVEGGRILRGVGGDKRDRTGTEKKPRIKLRSEGGKGAQMSRLAIQVTRVDKREERTSPKPGDAGWAH